MTSINESNKKQPEILKASNELETDCLLQLTENFLPSGEAQCEYWVNQYDVDQHKFLVEFLKKIHVLLLQGHSPEEILNRLKPTDE